MGAVIRRLSSRLNFANGLERLNSHKESFSGLLRINLQGLLFSLVFTFVATP